MSCGLVNRSVVEWTCQWRRAFVCWGRTGSRSCHGSLRLRNRTRQCASFWGHLRPSPPMGAPYPRFDLCRHLRWRLVILVSPLLPPVERVKCPWDIVVGCCPRPDELMAERNDNADRSKWWIRPSRIPLLVVTRWATWRHVVTVRIRTIYATGTSSGMRWESRTGEATRFLVMIDRGHKRRKCLSSIMRRSLGRDCVSLDSKSWHAFRPQ